MSRGKNVVFIGNKMSYTIRRGLRGGIIVLNAHASTEDNSDDTKNSSQIM
jgi:hypothetical protein